MKKKILIVISIIVALSLLIGAIATVIGTNDEDSSIAIIGGADGPTEVYVTDGNGGFYDQFIAKLAKNEFLPGEVIANLTEFSVEEDSDGSPFYYWRSYGESNEDVIHKIEMAEEDDKLSRYHYKNYSFDIPLLDTPMPMDDAKDMVDKFSEQFISSDEDIQFKNKPSDHTLYDPGHVELWFANYNSKEYVVAVDLDMGSVVYFEIL